MRLFILNSTRDELVKRSKESGGFVSTEIMVTDDLGVPSGNVQKWVELYEKEKVGESPAVSARVTPTVLRKISKRVYEY